MKNVVALAIIFGATVTIKVANAAEESHRKILALFNETQDQMQNLIKEGQASIDHRRQLAMIERGLREMRQRRNNIERRQRRLERSAGIASNGSAPFSSKILSNASPLRPSILEQESSLPTLKGPSLKRKTSEALSTKQP